MPLPTTYESLPDIDLDELESVSGGGRSKCRCEPSTKKDDPMSQLMPIMMMKMMFGDDDDGRGRRRR